MSKLIIALSIVVGLPFWWIVRDVTKVRSFCSEATQGKSLTELTEIAKEYGIDTFNKSHSLKNSKNWLLIVPSNNTMGEFSCFIIHDNIHVIHAVMDEPK